MTVSTPYTELELLQQIARGDEAAFRHLYNLHWNRIYSLALAYLKSADQAQDIVQEVFLKLWNKRENLSHVENVAGFIYIMGRNEVISALQKRVKLAIVDEDNISDLPQDILLPDHALDTKELAEKIKVAISQLPPQQQLIFQLSREEGLNHEQIADRLGIARTTVKNHIVRALHALRQALGLQGNHLLFWYIVAEWVGRP